MVEEDMLRGYCCFKSILCGSDIYLVPIHKMIEKRYEKGDFKQISQGVITIIIIHCSHHLSSHWLKAYS